MEKVLEQGFCVDCMGFLGRIHILHFQILNTKLIAFFFFFPKSKLKQASRDVLMLNFHPLKHACSLMRLGQATLPSIQSPSHLALPSLSQSTHQGRCLRVTVSAL